MTLLALILIPNTEVYAGITGKIAGVVRDSETGETLPAANVVIVGTNMGAAADENGYFYITNIPPGTYSAQARVMGYESVTITEINVDVDHTTMVNFELRPTVVEVEGITVTAQREIVKMDISSSQLVAEGEELKAVPLVNDINDYLNLQAGLQYGFDGLSIRGGEVYQTGFMLDGLMLVDNRTNEPLVSPNISSIKEIQLIKGGFNAEYGNVRSGLLNIVTKEGSPKEYHGSIEYRYIPAHKKHFGLSAFDPDNYFLRPYLEEEDSVCWLGTGQWPDSIRSQYPEFEGWIKISDDRNTDGNTLNDLTPEECRDLYMWLHRVEGSGALGQREGEYGHKPDWYLDASFGGPVIQGFDKLSFFASYRTNREMFALPVTREYYAEDNALLKLTSKLSQDMKLNIEGTYGLIKSTSRSFGGTNSYNDYLRNSEHAFYSGGLTRGQWLFIPGNTIPFDAKRMLLGISFDHALSPSTFYNIRLTYIDAVNKCDPLKLRMRDTTIIDSIGMVPLDEVPYGYYAGEYDWILRRGQDIDGAIYSAHGTRQLAFDSSSVQTLNLKFDITSQMNKYNEVKLGLVLNYDELQTLHGALHSLGHGATGENDFAEIDERMLTEWESYPIRGGAYIQDKIEYAGIIANIGLRVDYFNPNIEWWTVDRYSSWFNPHNMYDLKKEAPKEPAESQVQISPRFGISHPISEFGKLFFNYGWFYGLPRTEELFNFQYGKEQEGIGIVNIGNPSAKMARTIAYELGYEQQIANQFLIHISGYYKDIVDQAGEVQYTNFDGSVDYTTIENNNYADIRGFEISFSKRAGNWLRGWINYDYKVITEGYSGREHYYQDERLQQIYGIQNPYQENPLARPILRAAVTFFTPQDWGPFAGGINLDLLYNREAGGYFTWDPLLTYELADNLQWRDYDNWDLRLSKRLSIGRYDISLFMDVNNLFNTKRMSTRGFSDSDDREDYLKSLHLPMYEDSLYIVAGYTPGNDKPGDVKSKDKPYINMPDIDFITYLNPRSLRFGIRFEF
jgi:hypothetical protein